MMKAKHLVVSVILLMSSLGLWAQAVPQSLEYYMLYELLDELITDGVISRQTAVKPYSRGQIAGMLAEAAAKDSLLSRVQREEIDFYKQEFALELDTIPDYTIYGVKNPVQWKRTVGEPLGKFNANDDNSNRKSLAKADFNLSLVSPAFHLKTADNKFKMMIKPILGMDVNVNKHGMITKRWYGAEIRMDVVKHLAIWGSIRDNSWKGTGKGYLKDAYYPTVYNKIEGARLSKPQYLNNLPGAQYKESNYGGDYSDMRGGIMAYAWWGSIGVQREVIQWGDAYHCSNILSGRNPAVPMITLQLTPCKWFQFDYFHAWLVSNVLDSTRYFVETYREGETKLNYRPANKFMAANMFTFIPCKYVSFSIGNSIVYGESTIQAAYFIPIAFYKSLDHLLTKGVNSENQNSQVFGSISIRPWDHIQLYGSLYVDEFKLDRLKPSNKQNNPISYLVGFNWSGWPVRGLSLKAEFARTYIATYTHSIAQLAYTSNSYNMGHYMGDNAQSIFAELSYRPVRGLLLQLNYTNDTKYNKFEYIRQGANKGDKGIGEIIAQKPFNEKIWKNDVVSFRATYEVFQNVYARVCVQYNNSRAYAPASERAYGEDRGWNDGFISKNLSGDELVAYYADQFCPIYFQGKNFTVTCGLNFSF